MRLVFRFLYVVRHKPYYRLPFILSLLKLKKKKYRYKHPLKFLMFIILNLIFVALDGGPSRTWTTVFSCCMPTIRAHFTFRWGPKHCHVTGPDVSLPLLLLNCCLSAGGWYHSEERIFRVHKDVCTAGAFPGVALPGVFSAGIHRSVWILFANSFSSLLHLSGFHLASLFYTFIQ